MTQLVINHRERYREAFLDVVVGNYMEQKTVHGTNRSINYEVALTRVQGGNCQKVVRPSLSDFLCDVELAAKRALTKELFEQFKAVYIDQILSTDELSAENKEKIEQQVGRMLIHRRIFPIPLYFRSKDLR